MRAFLLTFVGLTAIFVGCGSFSGCGNKSNSGDIPTSAYASAEALGRAQTQYGGEWSRVPVKDKQLILQHFAGDEAAAAKAIQVASMAPKAPTMRQPPSQMLPR